MALFIGILQSYESSARKVRSVITTPRAAAELLGARVASKAAERIIGFVDNNNQAFSTLSAAEVIWTSGLATLAKSVKVTDLFDSGSLALGGQFKLPRLQGSAARPYFTRLNDVLASPAFAELLGQRNWPDQFFGTYPVSGFLDQLNHNISGGHPIGTSKLLANFDSRSALSAAAALSANFSIEDAGLTAALATIRASTILPRSIDVTRIGRGWASLTDRALLSRPNLVPLLAPSNRLASTAFVLELASGQERLPDEAEELFDTRRDIDPTAEWLAALSPTLADYWLAMWERMRQRGPAWRSQGAHCGVEFLDELLLALAPNDRVVTWQIASGKHADLYSQQGKHLPLRRLRLIYIGHLYEISRFTVEGLFMAVPGAIKSLQEIKHTSHEDEQFESLIGLTREVVAILVPNRPE